MALRRLSQLPIGTFSIFSSLRQLAHSVRSLSTIFSDLWAPVFLTFTAGFRKCFELLQATHFEPNELNFIGVALRPPLIAHLFWAQPVSAHYSQCFQGVKYLV